MNERRTRWLALYALCLGDLMIVLDTNIVNVALPSIRTDLGFTETSLVWVVNAYMLTFGGFLLLSGRLGDLYGNRRVLLGGVAAFTVSSVACAFARSPGSVNRPMIRASATAETAAPPSPCTARPTTRKAAVGANAQATDATVNAATPPSRTRRLP